MVVSDSERTHEAKATDINLQKNTFHQIHVCIPRLGCTSLGYDIFSFFIFKQATASISTPAFCCFFLNRFSFFATYGGYNEQPHVRNKANHKDLGYVFPFFLPQILQFCYLPCGKRQPDMHYSIINRILSTKRTSTILYFL